MDLNTLSFFESQIKTATIFVVSKTSCKSCTKAKKLLNRLVIKTGSFPSVFEVDTLDRKVKKGLMKYLFAKTGIKTVPQIWINGRFVGGNDDIQKLHREGRLVSRIQIARKPRSRTESIFSNHSSSPSVTLSAKSIPSPICVADSTGNIFSTSKSQRSQSHLPVDFTEAIYIPAGVSVSGKYSNSFGNGKLDMSMTDLEGNCNYVSDKPLSQPQRNSYVNYGESRSRSLVDSSNWSFSSATRQLSVPEVRENNWVDNSSEFSSSSSILTTQRGFFI